MQILTILRWHPAKLNQLMRGHWQAAKLKKSDRKMVATYARIQEIEKATGKRRVGLKIILGPRQRAGDPDGYWKSLLDALVHARLLVDDNRQNCELVGPLFARDTEHATLVSLEDI